MRTIPIALMFLPALIAGSIAPAARAAVKGPAAFARLVDGSGAVKGMVGLRQVRDGVRVGMLVSGLRPGPKGLHFHTAGKCDGPDFASAGGHWNPTGMKHGKDSGAGPHMGDLPNLVVDASGSAKADFLVKGATLTGGTYPMLDADGTAIMIHAGPDDYKTDPSGNSGARIACGVVTGK